MISVREAKNIILNKVKPLNTETVPLQDALGTVLAYDLVAPVDLPGFRQSAMDGYGLNYDPSLNEYPVIAKVKAGDLGEQKVAKGEAVRIYTGARVPDEVTTVIMQEHVEYLDGKITFTERIKDGLNIRLQGEQIKTGELALHTKHQISAASIGFIAGLGVDELEVIAKPKIVILITGNELVEPGEPLKTGQVYESNSYALLAALEKDGLFEVDVIHLEDQRDATISQLVEISNEYDLIISTGGISVGDYDFMGIALKELDAEKYFYKVKQKPGKPLYFGKLQDAYVFSLPGNPAAALVCYYEYVRIALELLQGKNPSLDYEYLPLTNDYSFKPGRDQFLKGYVEQGKVTILDGQLSFVMKSFAESNAIVYAPSSEPDLKEGMKVKVRRIA